MKPFSIIVAVDEKMGIGKGGTLPWKLSKDMEHFRQITTDPVGPGLKNVVIMGRKTWESLPSKFRPLPGRMNVVLTSEKGYVVPEGVSRFSSLEEALERFCDEKAGYGHVFVIGGAQVYAQALKHPLFSTLYLTRVLKDFSCDVSFPHLPLSFQERKKTFLEEENGLKFFFCDYSRHSV